MSLSQTYLPPVDPLSPKECDQLVWNGPLAHIGPLHTYTPLRNALSEKTNCACYLIMVGMVGLAGHLTQARIATSFHDRFREFVYLYQFDWRYPKPWPTDPEYIAAKPKWDSIKQSTAYYFLRVLQRSGDPFHDAPVTQDTAFMINFVLHLAGPSREPVVQDWIRTILDRLDRAAPCPDQQSPYYPDFSSAEAYLKVVLHNHGTPLSPRLLDPMVPLSAIDNRTEALATLDSIDVSANPVLRPASEFTESWGVRGPYFSAAKEW